MGGALPSPLRGGVGGGGPHAPNSVACTLQYFTPRERPAVKYPAAKLTRLAAPLGTNDHLRPPSR